MEQLGELAQKYWFVLVGGVGVLVILGAVFNWKWMLQQEGGRRFMSWIYEQFGENGYRIAVGVVGALIVVLTVLYALLLAKL